MAGTISAIAVVVLVPFLLLVPADPGIRAWAWAMTTTLAVVGAAVVLLPRGGRAADVVLGLTVPLFSLVVLFVWTTGLIDPAPSSAGAVVVLVFATSEFGRAVGPATLALLTVVAGMGMHVEGGWATVLHLPVLVAVLGMAFALTRQLVADHDRVAAQLHAQAEVDVLTGLVNRRAFDQRLGAALATGADIGLVLVDVDEFKAVNDAHGHPGGDAALQHVAALLVSAVRPRDSVVCRLGGDEMAVLLLGCPPAALGHVAADLVATVGGSPATMPGGARRRVTVSAGAAHGPTRGTDVRTLYAAADEALYAAKAAGRDRASLAGTGLLPAV